MCEPCAMPYEFSPQADKVLADVLEFMDEISSITARGERILIALAANEENPVSQTVAQFADAALLCVLFESMTYGESHRTVKKIGKDRFLGSAVLRP